MTRKCDDIRKALDSTLSGVSRDPALFNRIVNLSKGEAPPVKRKLTLSMAFVLVLALITSTVAIAAAYRGVSYFLFEMYGDPDALDEDYLISGMEQSHSDPLVNVFVTDAYWDGVDLSIAYHVAPVDPGHSIRVDYDYPGYDGYRPVESSDIQLQQIDLSRITITDHETGEITRPHRCSFDWAYEADGSLSVFTSFALNSMSESATVSIPISLILLDTGEQFDSMLHYQLPVLEDPVAEHEHDWLPPTCVGPMICSICGRSGDSLGDHNFQFSEDFEGYSTCTECGYVKNWSQGIPSGVTLHPGDTSDHVFVLHMRLRELGFLFTTISNTYNDATVEAVKAFQESQGLLSDGICGLETIQKLFH